MDLGNQTAAKAGAAMSSRQVMDIVDERGQKIRGFFTEDEYVNALKLFRSRAGQLKTPEGFDGLAEMSELIGTNLTGSRKLTLTYSALKDISSLQVIDFLCGNIDRHAEPQLGEAALENV